MQSRIGHGIVMSDRSKGDGYYVWYAVDYKEVLANQNQDETKGESMRNPDTFTQKEVRRKKIRRDTQYDRFSDTVKERKPRKPRVKNIKYYEYSEWDE